MRIKSGQEILRDLPKIIVGYVLLQLLVNILGAIFGFSLNIMPWPFNR